MTTSRRHTNHRLACAQVSADLYEQFALAAQIGGRTFSAELREAMRERIEAVVAHLNDGAPAGTGASVTPNAEQERERVGAP